MYGLVIGANGLVGQSVAFMLDKDGLSWSGTCFQRNSSELTSLDILDFRATTNKIKELSPEVVYLCANRSGGVNWCETNYDEARTFHFEATKNIAQTCLNINAKFVFFSTDYVFADSDVPLNETATPSPLNKYGEIKLEIERWVQNNLKKYVIGRTTNVYGWDPETKTPNYFMNLYRQFSKGEMVKSPSCLFGTPTFVDDLTRSAIELIRNDKYGLFHIVGSEYMNRYQWAQQICRIFGFDQKNLVEIESINNDPQRPLKIQLDNSRVCDITGVKFNSVENVLKEIKVGI